MWENEEQSRESFSHVVTWGRVGLSPNNVAGNSSGFVACTAAVPVCGEQKAVALWGEEDEGRELHIPSLPVFQPLLLPRRSFLLATNGNACNAG